MFTQLKQRQKTASQRGFQRKLLIDKLKENMHRSFCNFVFLDPTKLNNVSKLKASMIQHFGQKSLKVTQGKHQRRHSKHQEKLINDLKENIGKLRENPGFFSGKIFHRDFFFVALEATRRWIYQYQFWPCLDIRSDMSNCAPRIQKTLYKIVQWVDTICLWRYSLIGV